MRLYIIIFLMCSCALKAQVLTPGNLVLVRVGDGVRNINSTSVSVELMEYTKAGVFTENIIPIKADVNCNRLMLSGTGSFQDGALRLSQDKKHLTLAGYNVAVGSSVANTSGSTSPLVSTPKVLARFSPSGLVEMDALIAMSGSQALRTAVTDNGNNYWVSGAAAGMFYVPTGNTLTTTPAYTTVSSNNHRSAAFYDGILFGLGPANLYGFGTNPSITSTSPTASNSLSGLNPYGFALLDMDPSEPGLDVLYVANQGTHGASVTNGLSKFSKVSGTWVANGSMDVTSMPLASLNNPGFLLDLTVEKDNLGNVIIYATRGTGANNSLVSILDPNGYNVNLTSTIPTFKHLKNAGIYHTFKGISFTPDFVEDTSSSTLPVNMSWFEATRKNNAVELKWSTLSESNNDHFQILRSNHEADFKSIAVVKGEGNSVSLKEYIYKDEKPLLGNNYYKLMQVDTNGERKFSNVRFITWKNSVQQLVAQDRANILNCSFLSQSKGKGRLMLMDIKGSKVLSRHLDIVEGMNNINIPHGALPKGIYVLTLTNEGNSTSVKLYIE